MSNTWVVEELSCTWAIEEACGRWHTIGGRLQKLVEEQPGLLPVITAGPKRGLAGSSHSCMGKGCKCVLVLGMGMVYGLAAVAWSW